jgi:hypothetical protein
MRSDLSGRGLLLVWTDVVPALEAEFNAWYDIVAKTRGLNPLAGDRFLDSVLMIEATSQEALSNALSSMACEAFARSARPDDVPACLQFRYGMHAASAAKVA